MLKYLPFSFPSFLIAKKINVNYKSNYPFPPPLSNRTMSFIPYINCSKLNYYTQLNHFFFVITSYSTKPSYNKHLIKIPTHFRFIPFTHPQFSSFSYYSKKINNTINIKNLSKILNNQTNSPKTPLTFPFNTPPIILKK